jgi:UDP-N-acetylglucosamine 2-epimerase (non-hydrolysing)
MLDQVLGIFSLTPDYDLNLMLPGQTPSQVAARVLNALDPLLEQVEPDWALVQGDTTTVMAASIAAHHRRVKVGHVEAGLRTYDRANPFPEEMNRVVTDHISDLHFAPTYRGRENLLREGISKESIFVTGNTIIDALQWVARQPATDTAQELLTGLGFYSANKPRQGLSEKSLLLVTAHRRESFGQPIRNICLALKEIARRNDVQIVYPVHRNPNVWEPAHEILMNVKGITLLPPVDYLTLVHLMKRSRLVLTDSGGIQEEAPSFGIPVLVLRETTERPEAVEAGVAKVVGTDCESIVTTAEKLLNNPQAYAQMAQAANPYGDGQAAKRIVDILINGTCEEFTGNQGEYRPASYP